MTNPTLILGAAALALVACSSASSTPSTPTPSGKASATPTVTVAEPPTRQAPQSPIANDASKQCDREQFVACESGEACATKGGELVQAKPCFDRAADACDKLTCQFGCVLYGGPPKQVHCAPNASTTSDNFKRCGGFSGWVCPEKMKCVLPPNQFDAMGTCVPDA